MEAVAEVQAQHHLPPSLRPQRQVPRRIARGVVVATATAMAVAALTPTLALVLVSTRAISSPWPLDWALAFRLYRSRPRRGSSRTLGTRLEGRCQISGLRSGVGHNSGHMVERRGCRGCIQASSLSRVTDGCVWKSSTRQSAR